MTDTPNDYKTSPDALKDRVILITGAGSGIGHAVSHACAQHKATVVMLGKRSRPLEANYDAMINAGAPEPLIVPLDLLRATPEHYAELAQKLDEQFGRLDGLVHNAARFEGLMPYQNISAKRWYQSLQVNLSAPYLMTLALLPLLQQSDAGRLLFTLEDLQQVGRAHWGAYGVSKYGLEGLFKIIADEYEGSSVTVYGVRPGPTRTRIRARAWAAEDARQVTPPEKRVRPYLYLLDPSQKPPAGKIFAATQERP